MRFIVVISSIVASICVVINYVVVVVKLIISVPPKTVGYTVTDGMDGVPSPPAPIPSRGARMGDLTLRRGTSVPVKF